MAGGTVASCVHLVKRRSRTPRCPRSAKRPIALCPKIVSSRPLPPGGGRLIWAFDPCRSTRGGCRQIEASLCQEASGGASKQRRGRGRSRGARVRERLAPKCRCSGFSRPRWIQESSLVVLPGPCCQRWPRSTWSWRQTASLIRRFSARSASFFDFPSADLALRRSVLTGGQAEGTQFGQSVRGERSAAIGLLELAWRNGFRRQTNLIYGGL